ncbi:hypothetical protein [Spirochaeta africana]|uniref:Uncharacterized protein n=1 Tax=Spirochaeta africana (strain ATCC 700263 / DSM 8902 / Z-7692) TaxID=889378 RepID=H9UFZ5_SPIAZ|nr:hypothetical protein [Spirochaeta africana]AFG36438.1 hypothetical protein Spiaf_0332 [Spirochaeta africana DSM 8902]
MLSREYQQQIIGITQHHLQQVAAETRQAFADACPAPVPGLEIYDGLQTLYGMDAVHRLTVFFVGLFSGEMDSGSIAVTQEEFDALGWLVSNFGDQLPDGQSLQELYDALAKAGPAQGN